MNKKISKMRNIFAVMCVSGLLTGCEDQPNTLGGTAVGTVGGGLAAAGAAKMFGASNQTAAMLGLGGAAFGGLAGYHVGKGLDKRAQQNIQQAAKTNKVQMWTDDQGDEFVAVPSKTKNPDGSAKKVKLKKSNGDEIIIETASGRSVTIKGPNKIKINK